jgi:hypothetical protein
VAVPDEILKLVERWCEDQTEPELRDRARLEDSHDRWHIVQVAPTLDVSELLDEIDADPDCLFFG